MHFDFGDYSNSSCAFENSGQLNLGNGDLTNVNWDGDKRNKFVQTGIHFLDDGISQTTKKSYFNLFFLKLYNKICLCLFKQPKRNPTEKNESKRKNKQKNKVTDNKNEPLKENYLEGMIGKDYNNHNCYNPNNIIYNIINDGRSSLDGVEGFNGEETEAEKKKPNKENNK
uniref:PYST-C1 domain-containing protein n=1 Tax=Strongyloides venezuelensis TaxID=75913 RepID=A0A0K0F4H7_STRVS